METVAKIYVGVDVSKKHLDVHFHPLDEGFRIENSKAGLKILLSKLSTHKDYIKQIAFEATGGYEDFLRKMLKKNDYPNWMLDPRRTKAFIISEGVKSKTDKSDAKMIALFAAQKTRSYDEIERSEGENHLQSLSKRRSEVKSMIVMEKNRLEHSLDGFCSKQIKRHVAYLEEQAKDLDDEMNKIIERDEELKRKIKIVDSVPGVGTVSAIAIVAGLPELGKIERKQLAALVGVAPYTRESGAYKGKARTTAGRPLVRKALFMVILSAMKYNIPIKGFCDRLKSQNKPPLVAMVASMRKLIVIINAMVRDNKDWAPV